ncbi:hypothetical protein D9758_008129 [Tetrapyrgos nigripes]|uniref:Uncharacterized protein n=1 Tax=Tetrapyrgos nigripes TaxID=182062 RepID=A0A8H5GH75_9AGAR|nr:hypothetical protein D9758_008129 [Tetrapyrgos nigripes]
MPLLISEPTGENGLDTEKKSSLKELWNKFGRRVGSLVLRSPIPIPWGRRIVRAITDKAPSIHFNEGETIEGSVLRRRLAMVQESGLALPLRLNDGLPPPVEAKGVMDKMKAWGVEADTWIEGRRERRNERRRRRLKRFEEGIDLQSSGGQVILGRWFKDDVKDPSFSRRETMSSSAAPKAFKFAGRAHNYMEKRRMEREIKEERKFLNHRRESGISSQSPLQKRVAEQDLLEHWATDEILWIVIMGTEKVSQIGGVDMAERVQDEEEQIGGNTLRQEMVQEGEE